MMCTLITGGKFIKIPIYRQITDTVIKIKKGFAATRAFTLIELLVVIGIIGILAAVVLVAVNPARQFASARDTQRRSDLYGITNAIYQYAVENNGRIPSIIPNLVGQNIGSSGIDLAPYLVPNYISELPKDPNNGSATDTLYSIFRNAQGRIVASASSELTPGTYITVVR